jgi:lipopolysaccharide biosynthesis glycosyltransferase
MLTSLKHWNQDQNLKVFVIHSYIAPEDKSHLVAYLSRILPSVSFLQADSDLLEGFPVTGHVTLAGCFRFLLPDLLPAGLQKVLFIDCDTIINASLADLWETSLENHALAAVAEHALFCRDHGHHWGDYFNSGVILVNLDCWRRAGIVARGLKYCASIPQEKLLHVDQDILNHLFAGQWLRLEDRWNACPHLFGLNGAYDLSPEALTDSEREAIVNPAIIHFAGPGPVKPWNARCLHPLRDRYRQANEMTPWASVPLDDLPPPPLVQAWQRSLFRLKCGLKGLLQPGVKNTAGSTR